MFPLEGRRVLSFETWGSGAFHGELLALMGADAINVEGPRQQGNPLRRMGRVYAALCTVSALYRAERTGTGGDADTNLFDTAMNSREISLRYRLVWRDSPFASILEP